MSTINDPETLQMRQRIEELKEENKRLHQRLSDSMAMSDMHKKHSDEWLQMVLVMAKDRGPQDKTLAFDQALALIEALHEDIIPLPGSLERGDLQDKIMNIRKRLADFCIKYGSR